MLNCVIIFFTSFCLLTSTTDGSSKDTKIDNDFLFSKEHPNSPASAAAALDRCEYLTLRLGSELADVFNAPGMDIPATERIYQDFLVKNLGFTPWIAEGIKGKTTSGQNARDLHHASGLIDTSLSDSPYKVLEDKWIYMFGDLTLRQIWASYSTPFIGNNFPRNLQQPKKPICDIQPNRKHHHSHSNYYNAKEGWGGPCGQNAMTCRLSGYGEKGILTYDWKHFPFEDYDEYLWGSKGPWMTGFPDQQSILNKPDLLVIQIGLHTCLHASIEGPYRPSHMTSFNTSMYEKHTKDIWKLMESIRHVIDETSHLHHTTVIILTSGEVGIEDHSMEMNACIHKMNRITVNAARAYGFAILDRGEIEHRLVYKSFQSPYRNIIPNDIHLPQPGQNIIATSLLYLYTCLESHGLSRSQNKTTTTTTSTSTTTSSASTTAMSNKYPILLNGSRDSAALLEGGNAFFNPV
eukprot:gene4119-4513_t